MASEEHRTENRLKPQSIYKQTVVANEHLTYVAASQIQMRAGIKENQERDFWTNMPLNTIGFFAHRCRTKRSLHCNTLAQFSVPWLLEG